MQQLVKRLGAGSMLFMSSVAFAQAPAEQDMEIAVDAAPAQAQAAAAAAGQEPGTVPANQSALVAGSSTSADEIERLRQQLVSLELRLAKAEEAANRTPVGQPAPTGAVTAPLEESEPTADSALRSAIKRGVSISGYVQVQYGQDQMSADQLQQGGVPWNQDRFSVRRGRLRLIGRWQYVHTDFEFDASTTRGPTASVRRASVSGVWPSSTEHEPPYLKLTFGLTEIPVGRELQQGQDEILFLERTTGSLAFFPGPVDAGVKLEGAYGPLRIQGAIMNGAPHDDRGSALSGVDPVRAPDYILRTGLDVHPVEPLRIVAGISFLTGRGFHPGADATKSVLEWVDIDQDGRIGAGEILAVAGRGSERSETFEHWGMGADLALELTTKLGTSQLYGEVMFAENLDRALFVADPTELGVDLRELSWYVAAIQGITRWAFVGVRYDEYNPNSDLFESRRGKVVPKDSTIATVSPIVGARWPGRGRLTFEYDFVRDNLERDVSGVPTDMENNRWTLRAQGEF